MQLTMTQMSEENDANNRKLILQNNELKRQLSDLTMKEQVSIDKLKDLREEHLKARSSFVEREEELKAQIKQFTRDYDKLHHDFQQEEKLANIKNEQIMQLETNLKQSMQETGAHAYLEDFLSAQAKWNSLISTNKLNEAKLSQLYESITKLQEANDKLEAQSQSLETELRLNKNDYENLLLEIDQFHKDIDSLQTNNDNIKNLLQQEQLKTEELTIKLNSYHAEPNNNILDSTNLSSHEIKWKPTDMTNSKHIIFEGSKISTSLNKLTVKMYELFKFWNGSNSMESQVFVPGASSLEQVFQGILCEYYLLHHIS